jgi:glycerol transport system ATP-binding protein
VARFGGQPVEMAGMPQPPAGAQRLEIGVRPEFVRFDTSGVAVRVARVRDSGRQRIVDTEAHGTIIRLLVPEGAPLPAGDTFVRFDPRFTQLYADGWLAS